MPWEVVFFDRRIEEHIEGLDPKTKNRVLKLLGRLEELGPWLRAPNAEPLGGNLYELRVSGANAQRFYYTITGNTIHILHYGAKSSSKRQQTRDIEVARSLLNIRRSR